MATISASPNKEVFVDYQRVSGSLEGAGGSTPIVGKGTVRLCLKDVKGKYHNFSIPNVYHVAKLLSGAHAKRQILSTKDLKLQGLCYWDHPARGPSLKDTTTGSLFPLCKGESGLYDLMTHKPPSPQYALHLSARERSRSYRMEAFPKPITMFRLHISLCCAGRKQTALFSKFYNISTIDKDFTCVYCLLGNGPLAHVTKGNNKVLLATKMTSLTKELQLGTTSRIDWTPTITSVPKHLNDATSYWCVDFTNWSTTPNKHLGKFKYMLTFRGRYNRFTMPYFHETRKGCMKSFQHFLSWLKSVKVDLRKVFVVPTFTLDLDTTFFNQGGPADYLTSNGCKVEAAPPGLHQRNGPVERSHRDISSRLKSIHGREPHIPVYHLDSIAEHIASVSNVSPFEHNGKTYTPWTLVTGTTPPRSFIGALHPIGRPAIIRSNDAPHDIWDKKGEVAYYIGVNDPNKALKPQGYIFSVPKPTKWTTVIRFSDQFRWVESHELFDQKIRDKIHLYQKGAIPHWQDFSKKGAFRSEPKGYSLVAAVSDPFRLSAPNGPADRSRPQRRSAVSHFTSNIYDDSEGADEFVQDPPNDISELVENAFCLATSGNADFFQPAAGALDTNRLLELAESPPQAFRKSQQATSAHERNLWEECTIAEISALREMNVYDIVSKNGVDRKKIMRAKLVYKCKLNESNELLKFKARLCACGYSQRHGIDYQESYASTLAFDTLRVALAVAARENLQVFQADVVAAFLYPEIDRELYIDISDPALAKLFGLKGGQVLKLNKALYGLVQAPYLWSKLFRKTMEKMGFKPTPEDPCAFTGCVDGQKVILLLYVDDCVILTKLQSTFEWVLARLCNEFKMTSSKAKFVLGAEIRQDLTKGTIELSQSAYIERMFKKFEGHMDGISPQDTPIKSEFTYDSVKRKGIVDILDCPADPVTQKKMSELPYKQLIGSLIYASVLTRPDIVHAVSQLAQVMQNPAPVHWYLLRCLLAYLYHHRGVTLKYTRDDDAPVNKLLIAYCDANFAAHKHRRSVAGWTLVMSGASVKTCSKLIKTVAQNTMAAEVHAMYHCSQDIKYIRNLLASFGYPQATTPLFEDNESSIQFSKNYGLTSKNKYLEVKYFTVRQHRYDGLMLPIYIQTNEQVADPLTKNLPKPAFVKHRARLMGQKRQYALALGAVLLLQHSNRLAPD